MNSIQRQHTPFINNQVSNKNKTENFKLLEVLLFYNIRNNRKHKNCTKRKKNYIENKRQKKVLNDYPQFPLALM